MQRRQIVLFCLGLWVVSYSHADTYSERRSNRQMAVTVCNDYRETNRLPCFVSRGDCPRGFEVLQRFTDSPGTAFSACRDLRHERPAVMNRSSTNLVSAKRQQLLEHFNKLIAAIEKQRIGETHRLPKASLEKLSIFFSGFDLDSIELGQSKALSKGCFTDCQRIFCASGSQVNAWTDPQTPTLSIKLLHQLAHAERCEIQGGRERFVLSWIRHLPDEVLTSLERGDPIDTDQIHFAMYMENHAKNRAESVCRRLRCLRD
ncbi:MAG: hypothetical protein KZQ88_05825 [Candidatus Thiodiazotropha sp. (ex Dulcina madagascariensis)]|nr:hypothetical protein [Candidatus Thiodiazotropha sp. (ex Dulcina madagascariensis)]MCU7924803.1 hypothetical protein [Candidatus Thiodiazotropha sp. (ex Dulcina madagascariensis)]